MSDENEAKKVFYFPQMLKNVLGRVFWVGWLKVVFSSVSRSTANNGFFYGWPKDANC